MAETYTKGLKTLQEKEKLLVTCNFSFAHSVFKRLVSQGRQKVSLCGNGLKTFNFFQNQTNGFVSPVRIKQRSYEQTIKDLFIPLRYRGNIFQTVNPFPYKPWFSLVCSTSLLKRLCQKEKLLVTSNFSFSHSVYYPFAT